MTLFRIHMMSHVDSRNFVWSAVLGGWTKPFVLSNQSMTSATEWQVKCVESKESKEVSRKRCCKSSSKRCSKSWTRNSTPIADDKDVMRTFAVVFEAGWPRCIWFEFQGSVHAGEAMGSWLPRCGSSTPFKSVAKSGGFWASCCHQDISILHPKYILKIYLYMLCIALRSLTSA